MVAVEIALVNTFLHLGLAIIGQRALPKTTESASKKAWEINKLVRRTINTVVFFTCCCIASVSFGQIGGGGGGFGGGGGGGGGTQAGQGQNAIQQQGFQLQGLNNATGISQDAGVFVGRNEDVGFIGNVEGGEIRGGGQQRGTQQQGNQNANQRSGNTRQTINFRTKLTIGFDARIPRPIEVSSRLQRRLANTKALGDGNTIQVALNESTATLKGVVSSEEAKTLATQLLRLEPGVKRVENQLTVAQ